MIKFVTFCGLLALCETALAGVVTVTNTTANYLRVTFDDGAFAGAVLCAPRTQSTTEVVIEAADWTATVETSSDGVTFSTVSGGVVTGTADFLSRAQLAFAWDGTALAVRHWRQSYTFYVQGVILGLGAFLPMFGIWLTVSGIRKGVRLGSEGAP